jgi:conjugal transfer pilus assembly protein TraW
LLKSDWLEMFSKRATIGAIAGLALGLAVQLSWAQDLGVQGNTYQIKEKDAIDTMKRTVGDRLANGGKEKIIKGAQDRYLATLENAPTPPGITVVKRPSVRFVDLTYTVPDPIKDNNGVTIVPAGMKINPLKIRPLTKRVFFIDAGNAAQLAYVKANAAKNDKVIALAGPVLKAADVLKRHVYMDVNGLAAKMKVKAIPSIASQVGLELKIEEVMP